MASVDNLFVIIKEKIIHLLIQEMFAWSLQGREEDPGRKQAHLWSLFGITFNNCLGKT